MLNIQELLAAITDMQRNAQQNLPVIPNNGNPAGAYNMPQAAQPVAPTQPQVMDYSQPSSSMDLVYQMLRAPLHGGYKNVLDALPDLMAARQQAPGQELMRRHPVPTIPQAVKQPPTAGIMPVIPGQMSKY